MLKYIEEHWKRLLIYALFTLLIGGVLYYLYQSQEKALQELREAKIFTQEQTEHISALQDKLSISQDNAINLSKQMGSIQAGNRQPVVSFNVQAPDVSTAVDDVQRRINAGDATLPAAAIEQTDRTVVTPITQDTAGDVLPPTEQKVDVYKINLRKDHRIKAGVTAVDGKAYVTIGYERGRVEGLIHFQGTRPDGVSLMYNITEW
jgi:hypothetical protein